MREPEAHYACLITTISNPGLCVGISLVAEQQQGAWFDNINSSSNYLRSQPVVKGSFQRSCYTVGIDVSYYFSVSKTCRLYTTAGLGITGVKEIDQYSIDYYNTGYYNGVNKYGPKVADKNKMHYNVYYSPIGIMVGRMLCYFFEFGFGYQGVLNGGISYRFVNTVKR